MKQKRRFETDYENLTLASDFIFCKVMQNEENCIEMLKRLTGNQIESVKMVVNQKVIKITSDSKGIRYDVYVEDQDGNAYDAEMQNNGNASDKCTEILSKRARAYQSLMDLNLIELGARYKDLRNAYVIFICTFDPFGLDLCCYEFKNICMESNDLELKDGRKILFYNTKGTTKNVSEETYYFLKYIDSNQICDDYTNRLNLDVARARMNKEWRMEYMKTYFHDMDIRDEGLQQGLQQGLAYSII